MHVKFEDLTGRSFTYLTALKYLGQRNNKSSWLCLCNCGAEKIVAKDKLISGSTRSCGCLAKELLSEKVKKYPHGETVNSPEYAAWRGAKDRCYNPKYRAFHRYGGRGVKMAPVWKDDFHKFYEDVGPRPGKHFSLDRINNDGDYEPGNVHWTTQTRQSRNKYNNLFIPIDGVTRCASEWCELYGVNQSTANWRRRNGWSDRASVTTPPDLSKSRS